MKKISIGIAAYNEEANISFLLKALLKQTGKFQLLEIIVVSDGSTDKTVQCVQSIHDTRIQIVIHKKRQGKPTSCNTIARKARGDILVLLDADVLPTDTHFLQHIIKPFEKNEKIGLVGANTISISPRTLFEKIIADSHRAKQRLYTNISNSNVYLCHGRARAFSKDFYTNLQWIADYPEDAQTYFFCLQKGFTFNFVKEANVWFRSPATIADHIKQHMRFKDGKRKLEKIFPQEFLKKEYFIPKKLLFAFLVKFFFANPVSMFCYLAINGYLSFYATPQYSSLWVIAESSKQLV